MGITAMKDLFTTALVRGIADELCRAHPSFDTSGFVARSMDGLDKLELKARAAHIAEALNVYLPKPFVEAAAVIEAGLGPELPTDGKIGIAAIRYMPHIAFVQKYGLDDYEAAIRVQAELTKRSTAEFSIRAFLVAYPVRTFSQMLAWATDDNAHLRRLASEGTRPRLPWAPRLKAYQQNPRPVLELLELLKDDSIPYVQRSVANNLNDIAKDHPSLAIEACRRWAVGATAGRAWIIRHALRWLVKAGNQDAIDVLGGSKIPSVCLGNITIMPRRVALGDVARLSFEVESTAQHAQRLLIDYVVHFVKSNGGSAPKVFKLRILNIQPGEKAMLSATVSFAAMSTRRHFPGYHLIEVIVNGESYPAGGFEVISRNSRDKIV